MRQLTPAELSEPDVKIIIPVHLFKALPKEIRLEITACLAGYMDKGGDTNFAYTVPAYVAQELEEISKRILFNSPPAAVAATSRSEEGGGETEDEMTLKDKLQLELLQIDMAIDRIKDNALGQRNNGNDDRAIFLEGKADGLSLAHRIISNLIERDNQCPAS